MVLIRDRFGLGSPFLGCSFLDVEGNLRGGVDDREHHWHRRLLLAYRKWIVVEEVVRLFQYLLHPLGAVCWIG